MAEVKATPGPALRIRRYDESGPPEPGRLSPQTARRLRFARTQWIGDELHQVFHDPRTGETFAVPTGDVAPRTSHAERVAIKPRPTVEAPRKTRQPRGPPNYDPL